MECQKHLKEAKTLCPVCKIQTSYSFENFDGKCFFVLECNEHGQFKQLVSEHYLEYIDYENFYFNTLKKNRQKCENKGFALFITDKCNMACSYCYVDYKNNNFNFISLDEIKRLLLINKSKRILLSGGEPTTHPDIFEIISYSKKNHINVQMLSNGLQLSNIEFCKKIKKNGLYEVNISTESFINEIAQSLGVGKQMESKINAIKNMIALKMNITLSPTIFKGINENQVSECIELAKNEKYIKTLSFNGFTWGGGGKSLNKEQMIMPDEIMDLVCASIPISSREEIFTFNKLFIFLMFLLKQNYCINRQIMFYVRNSKKDLIPITSFFNIKNLNNDLQKMKPLMDSKSLFNWLIFISLIMKHASVKFWLNIPLFTKLLIIRVLNLSRFGLSSNLLSIITHTGCSDYYSRLETTHQCICNMYIKTNGREENYLQTTPFKYYVKKQ